MKKLYWLVMVLVFGAILVSACGTKPVAPEEADIEESACVSVESDNGKNFGGTNPCVTVDTRVYTLKVKVIGTLQSNSQTEGSVSGTTINGTGGVSGSIWTEGKGILPIQIVSLSPEFEGLQDGDLIVIKTTDMKAMGLPVGAVTTFLCNKDPEALSPLYERQPFTTDRVTYELDDCRMESPKFDMPVKDPIFMPLEATSTPTK